MKKTVLMMGAAGLALTTLSETGDLDEPIVDPSRPLGLFTYDVGDYVQAGLVAHFDAIRNTGAGAPHDVTATTWANLVAGGPDAAFHPAEGLVGGYWTDTGYMFTGTSYAQVKAGIALGTEFTIQVASDINYALQPYNGWANVFAAPNDFCFFLNNNSVWTSDKLTDTLQWKSTPWAGNTRLSGSWAGDYFTASANASTKALYYGTVRSEGSVANRDGTTAIPATQWTWGGSAAGASQRYLVGEIHSVRLYTRELTDAEVAQNRLVDDFRFRTNANVVVVSTVPGVEANEASGAYGVNGSHTFTAPAEVAKGAVTYAPVGYALETWNAANGCWNPPEEIAETSFAYTNCLARPRVRLTWIWKPVRGVIAYDETAYAQSGLAFNFDGLANQGRAAARDTAAETWVDSGPRGLSASLVRFGGDLGQPGAWFPRGYAFAGDECFLIDTKRYDLGTALTIQTLTDYESSRQVQTNGWPTLFGTDKDAPNVYLANTGDELIFKADLITGSGYKTRATTRGWRGTWATAYLTGSLTALRVDTVAPEWTDGGSFKGGIGPRAYSFGGISSGALRSIVGALMSVRAYTRVLSNYEVRRNRDIDVARYFGAAPTEATEGGVMVAANVAGLAGSEANGFYEVLGDAHTFTCATDDVTRGGKTYRFAGYTLETWNADAATWNYAETGTAANWTYTPGASATHCRLTWRWTVAHGLKTAADYTLADYVQLGLVAHYDGLANCGEGIAHAAASKRWKDLTYRDNFADLNGANTTPGAWTEKGYEFRGSSYFVMRNKLALGNVFTAQVACDFKADEQDQNYPTLLGMRINSDSGIFWRTASSRLEWKNDDWCGINWSGRSLLYGWNARYFTALMDETQMALFDGTTPANVQSRAKVVAANFQWILGGAHGSAADHHHFTGTMHGARFYNRALTDAELAQNRRVDDARYHGVTATNVVVATNRADCHGTEANGAYEVEGTWTFTAAPVTVDGEVYTPRSYTLETWNGSSWGAKTRCSGSSYTYDTARQTAPVRLTWRYSLPGLSVILR